MKSADKYVKKIEDKKLKDQADKVKSTYEKRHDSFNKMYDSYNKSLKQEKELYTMLQDKGTKLKDISEKVKVVNQSYKDIESEKTSLMNLRSLIIQKNCFYKQANIKIKKRKKKQFGLQLAKLFYFLYRYDYTMGQVHLISFLVLALQDQYNLEVFFATVKDKVVFGFR